LSTPRGSSSLRKKNKEIGLKEARELGDGGFLKDLDLDLEEARVNLKLYVFDLDGVALEAKGEKHALRVFTINKTNNRAFFC
jgi:hypothetical protein